MEAHIQSYLRVAAGSGREVLRIGPFLATVNHHDNNRFLNYAIPDDGAVPSTGEVNALIEAYRQRSRTPRLEYIAQLAPAVEARLLEAGFTVEGKLPLMVCRPGQQQPLQVPAGIELLVPSTDAELLGVMSAQSEAYGGDGRPDPHAVERLRQQIDAGEIVVLARDTATGEAAGGGMGTAPHDGLSEVAGIGVRPAYRRRGIAGALTARLLREAFDAGVTLAFLMAAGEAEARNYARAGFQHCGRILHISLT